MEAEEKGRQSTIGEVKSSNKRGIPQILLQIVSVECPFCNCVGYSKKRYRTIWKLKCHIEYYHRSEYTFSQVIENLRKGVLP